MGTRTKLTRHLYVWGPLSLLAATVVASDYEQAPVLSAAEILPAELQQGDNYRVDDRVRNDGYLNYFTIDSDYGKFEAVGMAMLRERIREIGALAELEAMSKSKVFVNAAAEAGKDQVIALTRVATNPVSTVKGIPAGIGRMFKRTSRTVKETTTAAKKEVADGEDANANGEDESGGKDKAVGLTESYLGVGKAERGWAQKLGTDPYTSNQILRDAIKSVAWAERLGRFTTKLAPSIPGAGVAGDVNDLVWSKDPYELRDLNRARLEATGADEELIDAYLDHAILSPTLQTLLTGAIAAMEDVSGRAGILSQALGTQTEAEARFFVHSVTLLAAYHVERAPFARVVTDTATPFGLVGDDRKVLVFAVDEIYWTDTIATHADAHVRTQAESITITEVHFLGGVSERCRSQLEARGWQVQSNVSFERDAA